MTVHGPNEFDRAPLLSLGEKIKRVEVHGGRQRLSAAASSTASATTTTGRSRGRPLRLSTTRSWAARRSRFRRARGSPVSAGCRNRKGSSCSSRPPRRLVDAGMRFEIVLIGDGPLRGALTNEDCRARPGRADLAGGLEGVFLRRRDGASLSCPGSAELRRGSCRWC